MRRYLMEFIEDAEAFVDTEEYNEVGRNGRHLLRCFSPCPAFVMVALRMAHMRQRTNVRDTRRTGGQAVDCRLSSAP
jgi:hypothetical protein